ncbi:MULTISPECIES: hypothetical protein [Mycobacteriaceae]|uniref:Uncharacterized protein n=1 Tax=Mycolicibacterium parafortuitum TaxID=39692 RepID=A0ACC6MMB6_MYCPF|nr:MULTISPECIES: hypothetical protein [Mycobacteriaceae]MDZ5088104.1 hypothetical protein [Mycolicibacterium parafortuitum]GFM20051.1 protein tyrosine phosphatase [Mycobacterium sp. PO1]GFM27057.1 protein tyrosine phosphatase [Mycobacterium sp. PO2]
MSIRSLTDLIVALDRDTAAKLCRLGAPADRIRLLRSFDAGAATMDVANPYGGTPVAFEATHTLIGAALPGVHGWVAAAR